MWRSLLLFITSSLIYCTAYAQIPVSGKVYELGTRVVLPGVKVQNTSTKDNTQTNAAGIFSIKAKAGDILIFESFAYKSDTVLVTSTRYLEIFMQPQNTNLKEVTVKDQSTKLGKLRDTAFHNQTVRYQRDENGNYKGGVSINFGYGKSSKEKRNEKLSYDTLATKAIDKAFSPANVSKYVPLKGVDLKQFIALYRPTIKQYKAPNFDMTLYMNDCYKKYKALPPDKRKLASLKADTTGN
ncbi:carboxypeptidase-like regulatory domain-containing protein [Mucilaginibacter sp. AW1-3]